MTHPNPEVLQLNRDIRHTSPSATEETMTHDEYRYLTHPKEALTRIKVGDRVRVERDEVRYPSKGNWPRFRGKTGTVVEINYDRKRPHLTEYGVVFAKARTDSRGGQREIVTWFKRHEVRALGSQIDGDATMRDEWGLAR